MDEEGLPMIDLSERHCREVFATVNCAFMHIVTVMRRRGKVVRRERLVALLASLAHLNLTTPLGLEDLRGCDASTGIWI